MARLDSTLFQSLLDSARQIAISLPKNPKFDAVAAALALKLSLDQSGKPASVVCPDPMTVEFHRLVGADVVATGVGSKNLVITFPGQTENVDKVSYNIENGILQLVITPKTGTTGLDPKKLQFTAGGAGADLAILIGGADFPDAKQFRLDGDNLSEAVTLLLTELRLPINPDAASNLLQGLEVASNNFTSISVTADTFEAAANLLRHGARRASNLATAEEFPAGSIPAEAPPADPEPDWYEPKIYRGTSTS